MRSPQPQPGNYLGDDPDLTAELGQRLAATAQTGQGLITNYLFYGQRRAAEQQLTEREDRDTERQRERTAHTAQADDGNALAEAAHMARRELDHAPQLQDRAGQSPVTDRHAEEARLTLRLVDPHNAEARTGSEPQSPGPRPQLQTAEDHLAVDALADNPSQRDPLADPNAATDPARVTLGAKDPVSRR
jgi:hypothetical protein